MTDDILQGWAEGSLRTMEACAKLDCTPAELIDTAAAHEIDFPPGLKQPTYMLAEDGPWTTFELLIANGWELIVTGADVARWPTDDPAVADAALQDLDKAVVIIVDNSIPSKGWENIGWIYFRDEGNGLVPVDALGGIAPLRRILDLPEPEPRHDPPLTNDDLRWPPMSVYDHLVAWHLGRMTDEEVSDALDLGEDDDLHQIARENGIDPPSASFKP